MTDIKLNSDGDLDLSSGGLELVTGRDAVVQHVRLRVLTVRGDWFRDLTVGVPYFEQVWGEKENLPLMAQLFRRVIVGTPGVRDVRDLAVGLEQRALSVSCTLVFEEDFENLDFTVELVL